MVQLNIRIPDELNNNLATSAKRLERPKGYIVRKALEVYLQEIQEDIQDYNDAVEILKKNNPKYSLEEVIEELGIKKDELNN